MMQKRAALHFGISSPNSKFHACQPAQNKENLQASKQKIFDREQVVTQSSLISICHETKFQFQ